MLKRTIQVNFKVSNAEHVAFANEAARRGLSLAAFLRTSALEGVKKNSSFEDLV